MTMQNFVAIFFTLVCLSLTNAQSTVNVLILYDEGDTVAMQGIDSAISFLERNPGEGVTVKQKYVMAMKKGMDIELAVNNTCDVLDAAVDSGEPPHIVLDAVKSGILSEATKTFTRSLAMPTFSSSYGQVGDLEEWKDLSTEEERFLVQLMPPGDIIVQSIRDIVRTQNLSNAAIIYDDTFVMDHKYKSLLLNLPCRHIIVKAEEGDKPLRDQLKLLKDADLVNFFAVGAMQTIQSVLDAATAMDLFGRKYSWYSLTKDMGDLSCGCENSTIVHMNPMASNQIKNRISQLSGSYGLTAKPEVDAIFYYNFALRGIKATGALASEGSYDNFQFMKCTTFSENNPPSRDALNLKSKLEAVPILGGWGEITWGEYGASYPDINLKMEKYKIIRGSTDDKENLGEWESGMPGALAFNPGKSLMDHQPVTIYRIVTAVQPPFMMVRKGADGKDEFYGYCLDLIEELRNLIPFEYEIYLAPDGKFGTMNDKMEWDGMVKQLVDKKADIAVSSLSVMAERENVIDFTVPYYDLVGISILMKKPKIPTSLFKFLTVLEPEVWVCILVAYGFTSILLWIFDRFSPFSYQNNKEKYIDDDEKREFSLKECFWFCMTSLTPQGGGEAPKNLSGRLVAATWWLFGFIIIASYTANLAAFLTVSRLDTPIESLNDLALQYKVQYSPLNGSGSMTYFERMAYIEEKFYQIWKDMSLNDSLDVIESPKLAVWDYPVSDKYTKIWQSMKEAEFPNSLQEALNRVRASPSANEGYAFIGDATDIRYQVLTSCDLQIIGDEFSRKPYALAVQQGSPLKDQLNDAILRLLNQRKLETLKEKWWNQNPAKKVCEEENDQSDGITIENIGGVFIVIFVGIVLACIALAFEYWWYKYRKGGKVRDSGKVLSVKSYPITDPHKEAFKKDNSNFNTEFSRHKGYDAAPVGNPW